MAAKVSLMEAIQQKWPGAKCVVRGEDLVLWEGPGPRPTPSQLEQAKKDYVPAVSYEEAALEAVAVFVEQRLKGRPLTAQEKATALADIKAAHAAAWEPKK